MSNLGTSANQTEIPLAANPTLPVWIWGLGTVLLIALIYISYQMVQTQHRLDLTNSELADIRKGVTEAQDTRAKLVKEVSSLNKMMTAFETGLSRQKGELKDANTKVEGELKDANSRLELALAESKKHKIAAEKQQKLALRFKQEGEKQVASLREKLSAEKMRLGGLEGELKDANSKLEGELKDANSRLELALAESKKQKMASKNWRDCVSKNTDHSIRGCTAIIKTGRESRKKLGRAYNNRGNTYRNKGDYDRAINDFDTAIKLNPKDADIYNNRGFAYAKMGDNERAIVDYRKAVELRPGDRVGTSALKSLGGGDCKLFYYKGGSSCVMETKDTCTKIPTLRLEVSRVIWAEKLASCAAS